ncbi:MAG: flagellar biosynthesis anti-sigma factor FlgM [Bryobacteraceae bacterium]
MHKASIFSKATQSTGAAAAPAPVKTRTKQDDREARIAELREQYLAGAYKTDAVELSRKIIDAHLRK